MHSIKDLGLSNKRGCWGLQRLEEVALDNIIWWNLNWRRQAAWSLFFVDDGVCEDVIKPHLTNHFAPRMHRLSVSFGERLWGIGGVEDLGHDGAFIIFLFHFIGPVSTLSGSRPWTPLSSSAGRTGTCHVRRTQRQGLMESSKHQALDTAVLTAALSLVTSTRNPVCCRLRRVP